MVHFPKHIKGVGGMVTAMQRRDIYIRGSERVWQVFENGEYNPGWEKTFEQFRPRRSLHSRRHYREVQFNRYQRDTLVGRNQGVGEGSSLHILSSSEWGEDTWGCEAEDPSIDDSQSQRWRGG